MNEHHYQPDATVAPDHRDERPCTCGLPRANRAHDVPDLTNETAEHRRRAGDQDQEDQ